jgi:hypothetical protein
MEKKSICCIGWMVYTVNTWIKVTSVTIMLKHEGKLALGSVAGTVVLPNNFKRVSFMPARV